MLSDVTALSIRLTPEENRELETVVPFDVGFPTNFPFGRYILDDYSVERLGSMSRRISPIEPRS